ncbi:9017_t:CDS:10 [Diversispora eburnea]|uniref:9017_t:CDS:1 n=1 Tax=Diversispora eburnea TaxID=1213867 RepID=A0A9N8V3F1_9GLOM|nr:9017_t:CDS:10 [Diversispora eburnea]
MITIKSKLDGTPESKTFALLEKGGPDSELNYSKFLPYILMNYNNPKKYPFLTRYLQYDKICNFLSIDQNEIKSGIRDDSYPKIPSASAMDIDLDPVPLNSKKIMRLILQDVNDLTKSARLVYQQNTNQVGKYCDLIIQDRSLFRYLRRNDVLLNLDYYLPIMLYKWDLTTMGIDYEIVKILVRVHNNLPPRNQIRLKEALEKMVSLARSHAHFVRMVITDLKILPELALEITLYVCSDVVRIFTRNTKWLTSATYSKDNIDTLHIRLMKALETEIEKPQSPPTNHRTRLCILIRIVCGFVSIFNNIRLSSDEIRVCLRAIKSAESERLKKLCLSFILLFADRIVVIDRTLLTSNFAQLVKPENTQLFILFAYFFHTNKLDFIEKLCREILTLDVVINVKGLKEIQGDVFLKGGLNIQPWILKQIQQIKTPIHPQFIQLLKAYVNSIFVDHGTYPNFYPTPITKIPEKEIYEMFVDCVLTDITPSHIIMCYYILTYNSTSLISNNYPEIFDIDNLLTYEDWELKNKISNDYLLELLIKVISELDNVSSESTLALKQITKVTPEILYEHSDTLIIYLLPKILDRMNLEMLNSMCEIWLLLYSINPHEAVLYFVNGLRNKEDKKSCFTEFQLMLNPSLIFRIDGRVLKFYMIGSRQRVQRVYQENAFKEESKNSDLLKHLHFAGYSKELVPLTTSKIESMHACLHWIHEIVNHEDKEKQLFGLCLAGNLCEVWPMQQTCEMAKKIIFPSIKRKVFDPTTKVLSPEASEILTILLKLHRVFEELRNDIVVLLREIISQCLESIGEKPRNDDMIRFREIFPSQVEP